jgi:hypothetical protein
MMTVSQETSFITWPSWAMTRRWKKQRGQAMPSDNSIALGAICRMTGRDHLR